MLLYLLLQKRKDQFMKYYFFLRALASCDLYFCKLFDSKVFPILSYGCELWGIFDIADIERVHLYGL